MDEVEAILATGDVDQLIGRAEAVQLEAKSQVHDLTSEPGRYELAKDVAAFANSSGGHLLFGPVTQRDPNHQLDIIVRVDRIPAQTFQPSVILGIIKDYVYPKILGISATFVPVSSGIDGIVAVRIPPQPSDNKPFLVLHVIEGGTSLRQTVVGYYERIGDANEPMDAKRLQQALKKGNDSISQRLTRIEDKLDSLADASRGAPARGFEAVDQAILDARLHDILGDLA